MTTPTSGHGPAAPASAAPQEATVDAVQMRLYTRTPQPPQAHTRPHPWRRTTAIVLFTVAYATLLMHSHLPPIMPIIGWAAAITAGGLMATAHLPRTSPRDAHAPSQIAGAILDCAYDARTDIHTACTRPGNTLAEAFTHFGLNLNTTITDLGRHLANILDLPDPPTGPLSAGPWTEPLLQLEQLRTLAAESVLHARGHGRVVDLLDAITAITPQENHHP